MSKEDKMPKLGLALLMCALCTSGCMVTHTAGVALSGYRAETPREFIFESKEHLYFRFNAESTTWVPTVEMSNILSVTAQIGKNELFNQDAQKRFHHCRSKNKSCLPPPSELKLIPEKGRTPRIDIGTGIGNGKFVHSECYEFQITPTKMMVYDNCASPRRKGEFSLWELNESTPWWAYPAKLIALPIAFAVDLVYVPIYILHMMWMFLFHFH